uniref:Uncharacterized protein n=1 Tax=Myoviridae sp. ctcyQ27 TaxID=2825139 RepID=A0A8S5UF86_9CAUD|nr:MAG TPA: hypothetical protein [Myoviridae sp. ctcyQ27]
MINTLPLFTVDEIEVTSPGGNPLEEDPEIVADAPPLTITLTI